MLRLGRILPVNSKNASGIHVLVVEPDEPTLGYITRLLELLSYKVTATQSGRDALSVLSDGTVNINLVLADILMDRNEFSILNDALKKGVPTILMSDNEDPMVLEMALRDGARLFLLKPLNINMVTDIWKYAKKDPIIKRQEAGKGKNSHGNEIDNGDSSSSRTISEDLSEIKSKRQKQAENRTSPWWDEDFHSMFVEAVLKLGPGNCYPVDIQEVMNVPGLTRMQISSHLKLCRDGRWCGSEARYPSIRKVATSDPARPIGSKLGIMPRFANLPLPLSTQQSPSGTSTQLPLGIGPRSQLGTAASSRYGTVSPVEGSASGSSQRNKLNMQAKLRKPCGYLKVYSKKKPEEP